MKAAAILLMLAAPALQFDITDARGKHTSAVAIEAGAPDPDGWQRLEVMAKGKGQPVLLWPFDGAAKVPDGPEPVPAIVIQPGDEKALANKRVVAAMATPIALGIATAEEMARKTGLRSDALLEAFSGLRSSGDAFENGLGLVYTNRFAEAAETLALALKERQRQLTRVPSEIYPAALLYGLALQRANKFDEAAVAFLTALKQRPSSEMARKFRMDALIKSGKPEAAGTDVQ